MDIILSLTIVAAAVLFSATDVPGIVFELNAWGHNIETPLAQLRSAIILWEGGVEQLCGVQALAGARTQQLTQVGAAAASELGGIIHAFENELEVGYAERHHEGECLKAELRK